MARLSRKQGEQSVPICDTAGRQGGRPALWLAGRPSRPGCHWPAPVLRPLWLASASFFPSGRRGSCRLAAGKRAPAAPSAEPAGSCSSLSPLLRTLAVPGLAQPAWALLVCLACLCTAASLLAASSQGRGRPRLAFLCLAIFSFPSYITSRTPADSEAMPSFFLFSFCNTLPQVASCLSRPAAACLA